MTRGTMLYLFDRATRRDSTWAALRATGYEVVSTSSVTQAMALLFLMQSVAGIVVDEGAWRADCDLVGRIRGFCPYLRVVLRTSALRLPPRHGSSRSPIRWNTGGPA